MCAQKNGTSAKGLQAMFGFGSYETAWAWMHKIRRAMVRPDRDMLGGQGVAVELDETSVGGRTPADVAGDDQLTYQVCDFDGLCSTGTVNVTVEPSDDTGGGDVGLQPCSTVVLDSFIQAPFTFTFQARNTTSESTEFSIVIADASYELDNLQFNGSGQQIELVQSQNPDGTFDIEISGVIPPFQSVGAQQPNGFNGNVNPTSAPPEILCS